jgi:DNA invertase Pin-like site-specific DNA recombinase
MIDTTNGSRSNNGPEKILNFENLRTRPTDSRTSRSNPEMITARRAVIYTRISDDPNGTAAGVTRQEEQCRKLAADLGMTVVAVLPDNDISAYAGKPRPGYRELLRMLRAREAGAVIAWHPDRLYRQLPDLTELVEVVKASGAVVRTVTAGNIDLSTASGVMVAEILASVSKHEISHAIERMLSAKSQAAGAGKYRGGGRPFGFEADGVTLRESEASHLRAATRAVIAGDSVRSVLRAWETGGVRTPARRKRLPDGTRTEPTPGNWTPSTLRKLLLRPRNAGLMEVSGEITGKAVWPAIVDEETWQTCKAILENSDRRTTPGPARRWMGGNLYLCGVCGAPVRSTGRGTGNGSVYTCSSSVSNRHVVRDAAAVDEYVTDEMIKRMTRMFRDMTKEPDEDEDESTSPVPPELIARADRLRNRLKATYDAFEADDDSDPAEIRRATQGLKAKIKAVEGEIAAAAGAATKAVTAAVMKSELLVNEEDVAVAWKGYTLDKRRAMIDDLITVIILPGGSGRPKGHVSGEPYFSTTTVRVEGKPVTV